MALTACVQGPTAPAASTGPDAHFSYRLDDGADVDVVNLSRASRADAGTLVQLADNSTVTQAPDRYLVDPPPDGGLFDDHDLIVITDDGLYWLSVHCRGGFLTGMWPLRDTTRAPGTYGFANIANGDGWAPNELLPGSEGHQVDAGENCPAAPSVVPAVGGEYTLAVPLGGTDASTTCEEGAFAAASGANGQPVAVATDDEVEGSRHEFTFAGVLGQEFAGDTPECGGPGVPNDALEDCVGNVVQLDYSLTYEFWDAGTTSTDFGGTTDQLRVSTDLRITPVDFRTAAPQVGCPAGSSPVTGQAGINLENLNTPMDAQYWCAPGSISSATVCGPADALAPMDTVRSSVAATEVVDNRDCPSVQHFPAGTLGTMCLAPYVGRTSWTNVEQTTPAGPPGPQGRTASDPITAGRTNDACTYEQFGQSGSSTKGFTLLYPELPSAGDPLQPAPSRVEFISDGGADPPVISPENSYIDGNFETGRLGFLPVGVSQDLQWDIQMQPYAPPRTCGSSRRRRRSRATR